VGQAAVSAIVASDLVKHSGAGMRRHVRSDYQFAGQKTRSHECERGTQECVRHECVRH
jgi:hypothetical protein